jgi:hypothetical protein
LAEIKILKKIKISSVNRPAGSCIGCGLPLALRARVTGQMIHNRLIMEICPGRSQCSVAHRFACHPACNRLIKQISTVAAVKVRIHRARNALAERLIASEKTDRKTVANSQSQRAAAAQSATAGIPVYLKNVLKHLGDLSD